MTDEELELAALFARWRQSRNRQEAAARFADYLAAWLRARDNPLDPPAGGVEQPDPSSRG